MITKAKKKLYTTAPEDIDTSNIPTSKPPFGYYGAKQRIASKLLHSLPPHNAWVEAFCGSAAITLAKKAAPIEVINDLDGQVVNVFKQLRENSAALCKAIALTPYAREEFQLARHEESPQDPLEKARRFLVSTMMTVNATIGSSQCGFSFSQSYAREQKEARVNRWYNLPDRLEQVVDRLRCVRVENRDAREILDMFQDRPATMIYLDPPYFVKRKHGYVIDAKEESFHEELLRLCCKSKSMILLSAYDNELYEEWLTPKRGWTKTQYRTVTRNTKGEDFERNEIVWTNRSFRTAKKTGHLPLRLTKQELHEGKINPPRT